MEKDSNNIEFANKKTSKNVEKNANLSDSEDEHKRNVKKKRIENLAKANDKRFKNIEEKKNNQSEDEDNYINNLLNKNKKIEKPKIEKPKIEKPLLKANDNGDIFNYKIKKLKNLIIDYDTKLNEKMDKMFDRINYVYRSKKSKLSKADEKQPIIVNTQPQNNNTPVKRQPTDLEILMRNKMLTN